MKKVGNNKKIKYLSVTIVVLAIVVLSIFYFSNHTVAVLQPRGPIAQKEKDLLLTAVGLMMIVVVPVFILTFYIVYNYREGHKGKYRPNFDHSRLLEATWWLIPSALIVVLAILAWTSSYSLDPYKPLASNTPPINIEVVAMEWKWLFIYPQQNIASVNLMNFPVNTPVNLYLTSDAPMNSFWVPQLSGQIYAMPGMSTQLHLSATSTGNFYGSSANISGSGFAGMHFIARASSNQSFNSWVSSVKQSKSALNNLTYSRLSQPSSNNKVSYYQSASSDMYSSIIDKYYAPGSQMSAMMQGAQ